MPIKISSKGPSISHLLFTDGLILMSQTYKENCECIRKIMGDFLLSSGQVVNTSKLGLIISNNCQDKLNKIISKNL